MNETGFCLDDLQLAIEDHEIISQFIANVSRLFGDDRCKESRNAAEAMTLLINKKIRDHFVYEESHVFTPILAGHPDQKTARVTVELLKEHDTLRRQGRRLTKMLSQDDPVGRKDALWRALMAFLTNLEDHASREDELFHTLLDPHARAVPATKLPRLTISRRARFVTPSSRRL